MSGSSFEIKRRVDQLPKVELPRNLMQLVLRRDPGGVPWATHDMPCHLLVIIARNTPRWLSWIQRLILVTLQISTEPYPMILGIHYRSPAHILLVPPVRNGTFSGGTVGIKMAEQHAFTFGVLFGVAKVDCLLVRLT